MAETVSTRVCIAGGGPAGMMLGLLLARAGIDVVVLEKHADFLRDFRGDTLHPSTLEVMRELGLLDELLALPHQRVERLVAMFGDRRLEIADLRHLPVACPFVALMPQWDFLDLLARHGARHPGFGLRMETEATALIEEDGRVAGVEAHGPGGGVSILADLTVAADGRHSRLRDLSGLAVEEHGAPMDVLWFPLERPEAAEDLPLARFGPGRILVTLPRSGYWQCGYVIPKGGDARLRERPIEAFRDEIARLEPRLARPAGGLRGWDEVRLLTVKVNRLERWHREGLLLIGDAAHAMSPVAGVGINLAIQDAVAAANLMAGPLRSGRPAPADLARVEARRGWPTRLTQRLQLVLQRRVIADVLDESAPVRPPLALRLLDRVPLLRRLPARLIGLGVRPEHVRTPEAPRDAPRDASPDAPRDAPRFGPRPPGPG